MSREQERTKRIIRENAIVKCNGILCHMEYPSMNLSVLKNTPPTCHLKSDVIG